MNITNKEKGRAMTDRKWKARKGRSQDTRSIYNLWHAILSAEAIGQRVYRTRWSIRRHYAPGLPVVTHRKSKPTPPLLLTRPTTRTPATELQEHSCNTVTFIVFSCDRKGPQSIPNILVKVTYISILVAIYGFSITFPIMGRVEQNKSIL